jgi:hypothetical protein
MSGVQNKILAFAENLTRGRGAAPQPSPLSEEVFDYVLDKAASSPLSVRYQRFQETERQNGTQLRQSPRAGKVGRAEITYNEHADERAWKAITTVFDKIFTA